jgi:hypothetical protein
VYNVIVEFRGAAYNCASSATVTDYVLMLSVTLLRVYLGRCVRLFCFKRDNAYYAPRDDVSRNMLFSIRTLGDMLRSTSDTLNVIRHASAIFHLHNQKQMEGRDLRAGLKFLRWTGGLWIVVNIYKTGILILDFVGEEIKYSNLLSRFVSFKIQK